MYVRHSERCSNSQVKYRTEKSEGARKEFLVYNKTALVDVSKPMTLGNKILFSLYLSPEKYN